MGKKSKILYYSVLLVNIVCFILDLLPINFPFFRVSFAVSLILIGILLLTRAFTLKLDSSMFIGTLLLLFGILNAVGYFGQVHFSLNINQLWPYYLFAVTVSSFITFLYFKDKLQAKISILFLGLGVIALLFVQNLLNLVWFIVLMVAWFVAYFVTNIIVAKKRRK